MNTKCQNLHPTINSEIPLYLPNFKPLKTLFKVKKKKVKAIGIINQLEMSLSNVSYKKINKFIQKHNLPFIFTLSNSPNRYPSTPSALLFFVKPFNGHGSLVL